MSKVEIRSIRVGELVDFIEDYLKAAPSDALVPISRRRAISQVNNPHAKVEDRALLVAYQGAELIGYLGILPSRLRVGEGYEKVEFTTTVYVPPDRRTTAAGLILARATFSIQGNVVGCDNRPRAERLWRGFHQASELEPLKIYEFPIGLIDESSLFLDEALQGVRAECVSYSEILSLPKLCSGDDSPRFFRSYETVAWMMQYPWLRTHDDDNDPIDARYFFGHPDRRIRYLAFALYDSRTSEYLGLQVFSTLSSTQSSVRSLRILDSFCEGRLDKSKVWALALQVARSEGVTHVVASEDWMRHLDRPSMIRTLPWFRKRSYFIRPSKSNAVIATALSRVERQHADGDTAFT